MTLPLSPPLPKPPAYYATIHPTDEKTIFLSLDVSRLMESSDDVRSMVSWFSCLSEDYTLIISIHCGSGGASAPIAYYITMLNAITLSKAKTIGLVDHIFAGMDAYFLLVCQELIVSDFGQIVLTKYTSKKFNEQNQDLDMEEAVSSFTRKLVKNAVDVGLLTQEEFQDLAQNITVYLPPHILKDRVDV